MNLTVMPSFMTPEAASALDRYINAMPLDSRAEWKEACHEFSGGHRTVDFEGRAWTWPCIQVICRISDCREIEGAGD